MKTIQGRASPDYNESLFRFGNRLGGFPADSLLGQAYFHYKKGMNMEQFHETIYGTKEFKFLSSDEVQTLCLELFSHLGLLDKDGIELKNLTTKS